MSDRWIVLIPADPSFVPGDEARVETSRVLTQLLPLAEQITEEVTDVVRFKDCGGNFEGITCASCGAQISVDWWQERMDADYDRVEKAFRMDGYPVPCCGSRQTLHELVYDWPQGFARYSLSAMNPESPQLSEDDRRALERALGCQIRVIYRRI